MLATTLRSLLLATSVPLLAISCADAGVGQGPAGATAPTAQATVHALKCGCAIESIGECGNYIEVDGQYAELKAPIDLGPMAFCHKDGLRARVDGRLENGVFVATSFAYEE